MGTFFVGWALWQDMTFVLGCCIVLVFVTGVVRLWWTNRRLHKYEVIEEERRARIAQMRHCGLPTMPATDLVPFGVRALESGVEFEGIWVSPANTPDHGRTPISSPPLASRRGAGDDAATAKGKETRVDATEPAPTPSARDSLSTLSVLSWQTAESQLPPARGTSSSSTASSSGLPPAATHVIEALHRPRDAEAARRHCPVDHVARGTVDVVNRSARRTNAGFEVLPAGALGPRHELFPNFQAVSADAVDGPAHNPARLQRNKPRA